MAPHLVIGIVGKIASGKGIAAEYIHDRYNASFIDFSQFLYKAMDIFSIPHERKKINTLSIFLRETYGQDVFSRAVRWQLDMQREGIVVIAGIRREEDLARLRDLSNFVLVYIESDIRIRYERNRSAKRKPGDGEMTFEEFSAKDSDESNNTIEGLKSRADHGLENNGSSEDFLKNLDAILAHYIKK